MEKLKLLVQGVVVVGVITLITLGFGWATYLDNEVERNANKLIEVCELDLPRNQQCELFAKPIMNK